MRCLRYNSHPEKLQSLIKLAFERFTKEVTVPSSTVIGVPLFDVLDPSDPQDYVARVEPSVQGGRKMAEFIMHAILTDAGAEVERGSRAATNIFKSQS